MPRHRREHVPRHRAQRTADHPVRRAQVTAAVPAPRSGPDATGPHGTELQGTGLNGFAVAGAGPAGTGPDDADTAPLTVLTGPLPVSFDSEISRLAKLAVISDGDRYDDAADGGVADNGADVLSPPGHRPSSHSRRRTQRPAGAPASRPPGVARGLLMTPWFAAASGFAIAASLWIYSSHPQLTFPVGRGPVQCTPDTCSQQHVDRQGAGSLAINSGQPQTPLHKQATAAKKATRDRTRVAATGLRFRYVVSPAADGNFGLTVIVTGKPLVKDWHLSFVLAGDQIQYVFGADWTGKGTDRVAASPWSGDPGQQGGGGWQAGGGQSDQGAGQGSYGNGGAFDRPGLTFTVIASGKPAAPTQCSFDGKSCTFHELPAPSQGAR